MQPDDVLELSLADQDEPLTVRILNVSPGTIAHIETKDPIIGTPMYGLAAFMPDGSFWWVREPAAEGWELP